MTRQFAAPALLSTLTVSLMLGLTALASACSGNPIDPSSADEDESSTGEFVPVAPECDPLVQDCVSGEACYFVGGDQGFACEVPATSPGGFADPCDIALNCAPGLTCLSGEVVAGCADGFGCCTHFCDAEEGGCPSQLSCVRLYDDGGPPGLENVGVCTAN